jgi:hypothetical protein
MKTAGTSATHCDDSAKSGLVENLSIPLYYSECTVVDTWGPWPKLYTTPNMDIGCPVTQWAHTRLLTAIDLIIAKKWNYCHHHSPHWLPPKDKDPVTGKYKFRLLINHNNIAQAGGEVGVCSDAYFATTDPEASVNDDAGWTGIDCSHFSSFTYNISFGAFLQTNIDVQACDNTAASLAVSDFLPNTRDDQDSLRPGDLLYIAQNANGPNLNISHVILWTGFKMDSEPRFSKEALLANVDPAQKTKYEASINANVAKGKPVYVIADSHLRGPNYRPFVNWYYTAFSHARRSIDKDTTASINNYPKGTVYDGKTCSIPNPSYIAK